MRAGTYEIMKLDKIYNNVKTNITLFNNVKTKNNIIYRYWLVPNVVKDLKHSNNIIFGETLPYKNKATDRFDNNIISVRR